MSGAGGGTPKKKFKGFYAGPDKYRGVIPEHLKSKYKGKYFGKESNRGFATESTRSEREKRYTIQPVKPSTNGAKAGKKPANKKIDDLRTAVENTASDPMNTSWSNTTTGTKRAF